MKFYKGKLWTYLGDGGEAAETPITDPTQAGSQTAVIRGLLKILADAWDTAKHALRVSLGLSQYPSPTTLQSAAAATGNGVTLDVQGAGMAMVQLSGTFSATVTFELSMDDTNWFQVQAERLATDAIASAVTVTGLYRIPCVGAKSLRARISAYTSGNVTVTGVPLPQAISRMFSSLVSPSGTQISAPGYNSDTNGLSTVGLNTVAMLAGMNGNASVIERWRFIESLKPGQANTLASGSALALWTPTSGKKFRFRGMWARASVTGRYELRDGTSTVIGYLHLTADTWTPVVTMDANGYLSAAANNVLNLYNVTGSSANLDALATGSEE